MATAQNWNMSWNTSQIVPEQLTDSVLANQNSQSSLLNIYFRLRGFQSLRLLIHFRYGPITCSHWIKVWHRTYPTCDAALSTSVRRSFAPLLSGFRAGARANVSGVNLTFPHSPPSELPDVRKLSPYFRLPYHFRITGFLRLKLLLSGTEVFWKKKAFFFLAKFSTSVAGVEKGLGIEQGLKCNSPKRPLD